jgi:hypothetical protein
MGSKNAEFDADFESVEKVAKTLFAKFIAQMGQSGSKQTKKYIYRS